MNRLLAGTVIVIALVAAGCGDDDDTSVPDTASEPVVAGQCDESAPDCDDTATTDDEPAADTDEDPVVVDDGYGTTVSGGMPVDGGLTVTEALATDAVGVIAVQGYIVVDSGQPHLCEALAESFPPQCGGAFIDIAELPDDASLNLQTEQDVSWTDQSVTLYGEIIDDVLVVDPLVQG